MEEVQAHDLPEGVVEAEVGQQKEKGVEELGLHALEVVEGVGLQAMEVEGEELHALAVVEVEAY